MGANAGASAELERRLAEAEARAEHAERLATMGRLLAWMVTCSTIRKKSRDSWKKSKKATIW